VSCREQKMKPLLILSLGIAIGLSIDHFRGVTKLVDAAEAVRISYKLGYDEGRQSIVLQAIDGELKEITLARQ